MRSEIAVREAKSSEYDLVADLTMSAYKPLFEGLDLPDDLGWYGAELRDVKGRASKAIIVVAELDDRIVGSLAFTTTMRKRRAKETLKIAQDFES